MEYLQQRAVQLYYAGDPASALRLLRDSIGAELEPAQAIVIGVGLADLGCPALALELSTSAASVRDPELACMRARWALRDARPELALAEADIAIEPLLQHGLRLPEFIRLALRGAPSEILLRFERESVARVRRLHEPLALRWQALRRAGRVGEAREMRAVCIRLFPERASVWAEAGSHAIDDQDFERADKYFDRCLQLDQDWTAALAGKAIVAETRKDWAAALAFRARVVSVEDALTRADPASLQRAMRYAAALARLDRWDEAGVAFRRCVALGAIECLPAERAVLLRVFSRELYAPALVARLLLQPTAAGASQAAEVALALREASVFAAVYERVAERVELPSAERLMLLGMCAWLAGDDARAYALLDEAEVEREGDLAVQYLLAESARALGRPECASIEQFALAAARVTLESARRDETQLFYAMLSLARAQQAAVPVSDASDMLAQLRHLVAWRALQRSLGHPALEIARASADAVARLERAAHAHPSLETTATWSDPSASPA